MPNPSLPPIVRLADDVVMLTGPQGIGALRYCIQVAIDSRRRNGLPASGDLAHMLTTTAPATPDGQEDRDNKPNNHTEIQADYLTTAEASKLLGRSKRSVTRLAPALGAIRRGRIWLYDRQHLNEHIQGKVT